MFSLAGLRERWRKGEEPVETFTVLTLSASPALAELHRRQPVLIEDEDREGWLDPSAGLECACGVAGKACEGPSYHCVP